MLTNDVVSFEQPGPDLQNFAMILVLPFLNNLKDLDPSYKMDLDFWDCFGQKLHLIVEEIRYLIGNLTKASWHEGNP